MSKTSRANRREKTIQNCSYNLKPSHGHDQSIVNGISRIGYMKGGGKALWKDENIADSITVHAIDFIKKHKDGPFFMYFATNDIHVPRFPHKRFRNKNKMGLRGDAIVQFDWSVGQLLKTLDELGLTQNTLILLSSDNGPVVDDGYADQAEELLNGRHTDRQAARRKIQRIRRRYPYPGDCPLAGSHPQTCGIGRFDFTDRLAGVVCLSTECTDT